MPLTHEKKTICLSKEYIYKKIKQIDLALMYIWYMNIGIPNFCNTIFSLFRERSFSIERYSSLDSTAAQYSLEYSPRQYNDTPRLDTAP